VNENPSLDINNDGITDFTFTGHHSMHRTATSHQRMSYGLLSVHGVESGNQPVGGSYASALKAGYVIGPSAKFSGAQRMLRSKDKDGNKLLPLRVRSMAHRPLQDCESLSGSKVPDQWRNSFRMGSHERAHYVGSFHQSASHGLRVRNRGRKTDCRRPKTEREPGWGSVESIAVGRQTVPLPHLVRWQLGRPDLRSGVEKNKLRQDEIYTPQSSRGVRQAIQGRFSLSNL
jgi:hypothetical protein